MTRTYRMGYNSMADPEYGNRICLLPECGRAHDNWNDLFCCPEHRHIYYMRLEAPSRIWAAQQRADRAIDDLAKNLKKLDRLRQEGLLLVEEAAEIRQFLLENCENQLGKNTSLATTDLLSERPDDKTSDEDDTG